MTVFVSSHKFRFHSVIVQILKIRPKNVILICSVIMTLLNGNQTKTLVFKYENHIFAQHPVLQSLRNVNFLIIFINVFIY